VTEPISEEALVEIESVARRAQRTPTNGDGTFARIAVDNVPRLVEEIRRLRKCQQEDWCPGVPVACQKHVDQLGMDVFSANVELDNLRKQLADEKAKALLYDKTLHRTLGSLHVINARAGNIVRWIKDPNLKAEVEAQAIVDERGKAHECIVEAVTPKPVPMCKPDALHDIFPESSGEGNPS